MFKTSCQIPSVETALCALLNLRSSAPTLSAEWLEVEDGAEIFGVPTDDYSQRDSPHSHTNILRGIYHQIGRFKITGHGSVEIVGCYHPRAFETCSIVFRGGLAICFVKTRFSAVKGSHQHAKVSWIEPGVPDQVRRERKHEQRKAQRNMSSGG